MLGGPGDADRPRRRRRVVSRGQRRVRARTSTSRRCSAAIRRCSAAAQEVIDRCWAMGDDNPILLIHDVGAGGLSNAVPEAGRSRKARRTDRPARGRQRRARHVADGHLVQRGAGALRADRRAATGSTSSRRSASASAARTRSSARLTDDGQPGRQRRAFGNRRRRHADADAARQAAAMLATSRARARRSPAARLVGIELDEAAMRVLRLPAVAGQVVPDPYRRSHRRRPCRARPDGRSVAGARVRCRDHGVVGFDGVRPARRWRWVSARRSRCSMRRRRGAWPSARR